MKPALASLLFACAPTLAVAQFSPEQLKAIIERANKPGPVIAASEFDGRYETKVTERIDTPGPLVTFALQCARGACAVSIGEAHYSYPAPGSVRLGLFERTQRSVAQLFPSANLRGCINLAGDDTPDGPFACKLDRDLDGKRVMLFVPPGGSDIVTLYAAK